ncbi:MAG: YqiA/YcfP family alpha/beta fold hydrolase [Acinetobacter sp.]
MNLIYLHGFQSSPKSVKGQQLQRYCAQYYPEICVHAPDLNLPPFQVMDVLLGYVQSLDRVAVLGSSLGGFYATCLALQCHCPAVLINPAVRPWQLFADLFGIDRLPYVVTPEWSLRQQDLTELQHLHQPMASNLSKILVLLQQGDETLDYRDAQRYYSQGNHPAMIMTETAGNHRMDNFVDKIPMLLSFLSQNID